MANPADPAAPMDFPLPPPLLDSDAIRKIMGMESSSRGIAGDTRPNGGISEGGLSRAPNSSMTQASTTVRNITDANSRKRKPCFAFQKGKCNAGDGCKYSHDSGLVKSAPRSKGVCYNFRNGRCDRGESCRYVHVSGSAAHRKLHGSTGALEQPWHQLLPGRSLAEAQELHSRLMPMLLQGGSGRGQNEGRGRRQRSNVRRYDRRDKRNTDNNRHSFGGSSRKRPAESGHDGIQGAAGRPRLSQIGASSL